MGLKGMNAVIREPKPVGGGLVLLIGNLRVKIDGGFCLQLNSSVNASIAVPINALAEELL